MPTTMLTGTGTTTNMAEAGSLILMIWVSPSFPVGAFAYSHGLEWAVETGDVRDADTCRNWIADLLAFGSGRNDALLLAAAWRAASLQDAAALHAVAELAAALQPSLERRLETTAQGNAFLTAVGAAWPSAAVDLLKEAWDGDVAYPVALGTAAGGHGIGLRETLDAFLLGFVSNIVSAVVRLGPIGQTDGQRILAASIPAIRETATFAEFSTLDELGACAFRSDIASMRHETQYTRLFRS
jgi:urease accessory protein